MYFLYEKVAYKNVVFRLLKKIRKFETGVQRGNLRKSKPRGTLQVSSQLNDNSGMEVVC